MLEEEKHLTNTCACRGNSAKTPWTCSDRARSRLVAPFSKRSVSLAGVAAEVRLPAGARAARVGAALRRDHAVGAGRHAAVLRHQHDGPRGPGHARVSSRAPVRPCRPPQQPRGATCPANVCGFSRFTPHSREAVHAPGVSETFSKRGDTEQGESEQTDSCSPASAAPAGGTSQQAAGPPSLALSLVSDAAAVA